MVLLHPKTVVTFSSTTSRLSSLTTFLTSGHLVSSRPQSTMAFALSLSSRSCRLRPTRPSQLSLSQRNYIFLPASFSDTIKLFQTLFYDSNFHHSQGRILVKLQTRWNDRLQLFLQRHATIKKACHDYRHYYRFHPRKETTTGKLLFRLLTHYHAKKRVYYYYNHERKALALAARKIGIRNSQNEKKSVWNPNRLERWRVSWQRAQNTKLWEKWRTGAKKKREEWSKWWWRRGSYIRTAERVEHEIADITWKEVTLTEPSKRNWFDSEGFPLTSRDEITGRFVNPWLSESTSGESGLYKFLKWKLGSLSRRLGLVVSSEGKKSVIPTTDTVQCSSSLQADILRKENLRDEPHQAIKLTWIGHSTTLVHLPGDFVILTDPHFSSYAGPIKRSDPPSLGVMDLPQVVDCVLISHDHMDHLDYWSILELIDSNKVKFWIVPLGIKAWLIEKAGVNPGDIVELEWWESVRITKKSLIQDQTTPPSLIPELAGVVRSFDKACVQDFKNIYKNTNDGKHEMMITCAPAQHWCSRTPFDRNRRLWCSWAVHATPTVVATQPIAANSPSHTHSFYFAGDTGLPPEFPLHRQIGDRLGPFDLAAIPIGAYEPRWFMRESHCNPAEAVMIHQALRSRRSVAIHYDTFNLADEPQTEPPVLLLREVSQANEDIVKLASELVVTVTKEARVSPVETTMVTDPIMANVDEFVEIWSEKKTNDSSLPPPIAEKVTKKLVDILPPLIDFAIISKGDSIASPPKSQIK